jgi:hypothetical protein
MDSSCSGGIWTERDDVDPWLGELACAGTCSGGCGAASCVGIQSITIGVFLLTQE